ncbi:MAG: NUDIX domain-containing protein [Bacteroidales bacterium]|nr:NUDIX domain-containing protein [Bacteroidales bacterium]MDD7725286.1 NUDIX domain-containing protein [Bacteroidales bacterium]MDY4175782.1 NUDIX domain-containing protein [Bacteroidales bacterium]
MKIFFNNRHIKLDVKNFVTVGYQDVEFFTDVEQLRHIVDAFIADEEKPDMCILADDARALEKAFLSLFPIINAAGGLIHDGDDEYLVIDRKGVPDLPKGKAEQGEGPVQTALREVGEETGLLGVNVIDRIQETYHTYYIKDQLVLKRTVWFSMSVPGRPKLTPEAEEGITGARWVSRNQMKAEAEKTYKSLRDIFLSISL